MSFCLIILAAGKSSRFNSNLPKVYHKIGNKSLVEICIDKAKKIKIIKKIILVYNKKDKKILKKLKLKNVDFVLGGKTRQSSTLNALRYLNKKPTLNRILFFSKNLINLMELDGLLLIGFSKNICLGL